MTALVAFADLDDTLFQTLRKLPGRDPADLTPATVDTRGEPHSYCAPAQTALLELLRLGAVTVIPVTGRDPAAMNRVRLPFRSWRVLDHGLTVLNPAGEPDAEWAARVTAHLAPLQDALRENTDDLRPHADALVTDHPGLALGILTADCAPVLFADREAGVVGAAHAGWKGALAGITDTTLMTMETLGADRDRIVAAVGPCIAQASYEVDDAFRRRITAQEAEADRFFRDAHGAHAMFDLAGYVAHRLAIAGVRTVEIVGADTYADEARFFSYRRSTHRGEGDAGRQISIIGIGID